MRRMLIMAGVVLSAIGVVRAGAELVTTEVDARPVDAPGFFITNDTAHPVPVVQQGPIDVSVRDHRSPFQRAIFSDNFGTSPFRSFHFAIPAGQFLVVEQVSASAVVETGQKVRTTVTFQGGPTGGNDFLVVEHMLTMERVDGFGPGDTYATVRPMAAYAGGDQGVIVTIERNSATGTGGKVEFSISGYLIDAPTDTAR